MPGSVSRRLRWMVGKKRWTAEEARSVLAELDGTGLELREFAERAGLDPQRLTRWRGVLGRERTRFVEIRRTLASAPVELVLRSGHVLRVGEGFGEETVRRLLAMLDEGGGGC